MKTKKFNKKLALKKTTVSNLQETELLNVRGGTGSFTCWWDYMCNSVFDCGATNMSDCYTGPTYCPMCPTASVRVCAQ
jgi:hypothetical protein